MDTGEILVQAWFSPRIGTLRLLFNTWVDIGKMSLFSSGWTTLVFYFGTCFDLITRMLGIVHSTCEIGINHFYAGHLQGNSTGTYHKNRQTRTFCCIPVSLFVRHSHTELRRLQFVTHFVDAMFTDLSFLSNIWILVFSKTVTKFINNCFAAPSGPVGNNVNLSLLIEDRTCSVISLGATYIRALNHIIKILPVASPDGFEP